MRPTEEDDEHLSEPSARHTLFLTTAKGAESVIRVTVAEARHEEVLDKLARAVREHPVPAPKVASS